MAVHRLLHLFANRFLYFSSISFCFSYSYEQQTKLASFQVNFSAHYEIVLIDWLTDWLTDRLIDWFQIVQAMKNISKQSYK